MSQHARCVLAVIACTLLGAGAANAQPKVSGTVNLLGYPGVFQEKYAAAVIEPFQKAHPNVKVIFNPVLTSAQMLGQLRAQKADPQVDVAILDVTIAKLGADEGIFAPLEAARVPNINDLFASATIQGVNGRAVTFDHVALLYNADAFKDAAPTSWEVLWDRRYKGKIAPIGIPDTMGILLAVVASKLSGGDGQKDIFVKGMPKMVELAPQVQTWDPKPDPYTFVANGSAVLGTGYNARAQYFHDQTKGKLGVLLPKEGSVFQINVINLVAGSKNREAAEAFINFTLSPEAQKAFTEAMFYAPTNKKAQISKEAMARTAASQAEQMIPIDWAQLSSSRERLTEQWRREVLPASR